MLYSLSHSGPSSILRILRRVSRSLRNCWIPARTSLRQLGRNDASLRSRLNRAHAGPHIMTYAEAKAEVADQQSSRHGESDDEDADDARRFAIADGDR